MIEPPRDSALTMAARSFISTFPVVLLALVMMLGLTYFIPAPRYAGLTGPLLTSVITALVAFAAHNYVLSGGTKKGFSSLIGGRPRALLVFVIISFLVALVIYVVPMAVSQFALSQMPRGHAEISSAIWRAWSIGVGIFVVFIFLTCKFGTVFPAIVDGGDPSLGAAWRRETGLAIFFRLIGLVLIGLLIGFAISFAIIPLTRASLMSFATSVFSWQLLLAGAISGLANFFSHHPHRDDPLQSLSRQLLAV